MNFNNIISLNTTKKPHVAKHSGNDEWYTPSEYIELARSVLGDIDLDPASNDLANRVVQAKKYYTQAEDGLQHEWYGNVWMNPPYSSKLVGEFARKLIEELPHIDNAIVLVNNATETKWFRILVASASAVCFPYQRIRFISPNERITHTPLQGQALLYFGDKANRFVDAFRPKGWCAYIA